MIHEGLSVIKLALVFQQVLSALNVELSLKTPFVWKLEPDHLNQLTFALAGQGQVYRWAILFNVRRAVR
ncbi:MAG: hypothetical protein CL862_14715 [Cyanobium sp. NAT70]|nr:hypothetical protein [Cyanobium sp. NAT70]